MSKNEERSKIVEAMSSENFEEKCEELGFTICQSAEEGTGKKKANL